ncbi:hypothetical protein BVC80_733g25 [Macleaya cordata]|uniref:Uncharacterized protein n=1 Tax=Macleaya cordata TaxID=56857 RepID=A0A200PY33_MACCD|nr:hypothetical protein BVC80_733g25 [Macleaya cordata]
MPGLPQRNVQFSNSYSSPCSAGSVSANGIWSKHRDDVTFDQLQKFWSELSPHARQELLRIDKQTLLEQARKNLYCSRCNGLLLEGFSQIVMYGKSMHQEGATVGHLQTGRQAALKNQNDSRSNMMHSSCHDDTQDPSVHPWGGLAATRDGILTLLDCFLDAKSLKALQNVFDSARARERERELLYPDACGGGGRGWISLGMANYGRGHGTRETCALHTARLSCDTLVDFWSALGDETRKSLLRMKEEDFIERLMYRFDSKRFCRDCRRNVIREFKELKELKRMRREPRCTSWFCVADTAFEYEVSDDTVQASWHQSFTDNVGTYHHFEWAIGTGEGKSDILEFEDVGMSGSVQMNGLDLGGLSACFITLRAWKLDGRCTELSVKAHAMKGQPCVHRRLVVGDGFVTISKGESIRRFFEHAEEAEEEEDDDSVDKDGNELDGEGSRPQKHAKSPELAREFLLDAATVIFKEQVEKAFREGTARQNAHSIFVCLALKLLEERVHVACKEIITLEKQSKLLEEEEKEKREEEERKERRRTKEREKKLRRKERLKGKEREREKECVDSDQVHSVSKMSEEESSQSVHDETHNTTNSGDSVSETGDIALARPLSPDIQDDSDGYITLKTHNPKDDSLQHIADEELSTTDLNGLFITEQSKSSRRKLRPRKEFQLDPASKCWDRRRYVVGNDSGLLVDKCEPISYGGCTGTVSRCVNGVNKHIRGNLVWSNGRSCGPKLNEKFPCSNNSMSDRYDFHSCSCNIQSDYRPKDGPHVSTIRSGRVIRTMSKSEVSDVSKPFYRNNKYNNHGYYIPDKCGIPKSKPISGNIPPTRDLIHAKKVWEPMESRKKYVRSDSDSDVALGSSTSKVDECEEGRCNNGDGSSGELCSYDLYGEGKNSGLNNCKSYEDSKEKESRNSDHNNGFDLVANASYYLKDAAAEEVRSCPMISTNSVNGASDSILNSTSSSDNCSSCLSEGDSSTASSSTQNAESWSTSDSEDASPQSQGKETSTRGINGFQKYPDVRVDGNHKTNGGESFITRTTTVGSPVAASCAVGGVNYPAVPPIKNIHTTPDNGRITVDTGSQQQHCMIPPPMHKSQGIQLPVFPAPSTMAYYHQNPASWSAAPAVSGLMPFPTQPNHRYLFTSPFGYGVSTNLPSHFAMQYSPLQPLTTPMFNMGQLPVYQPVNKVTSNEQTNNSKLGGAFTQEAITNDAAAADTVVASEQHPVERPVLNAWARPEAAASNRQNGCIGKSANVKNDGGNFSLFHYGGPTAVGTGSNNSNIASLKEGGGKIEDFSSSNPPTTDPNTQVDLAFSKKETTIEEYSLFASSNGTRFSFF